MAAIAFIAAYALFIREKRIKTVVLRLSHNKIYRYDCTSLLALAIDISMPTARPKVTMAVPP